MTHPDPWAPAPVLIHRLDATPPLHELLKLPPSRWTADWSGTPPPCDLWCVVALTPDALLFGGGASEAPRCDRSRRAGEFVEGLWASDVVELFVGEAGAEGYLELNLAPTGAFWLCRFARYRERHAASPGTPLWLDAVSSIREGSWQAAISLPRDTLPPLDLDRVNACAIREDPRRFYTMAPPRTAEPDFHRL